jgi:hypothetical protein
MIMEEKYLIGPISVLQELYPDHDFDHARKSLDGNQCVIEKEVDQDTIELLESENVLVLSHSEAIEHLNSELSTGLWYEPVIEDLNAETINEGTIYDEPTDI